MKRSSSSGLWELWHRVKLLTFRGLLRKLFDLGPHVEDAVRSFEGTVLQSVYVEQDAVLQSDLEPGKVVQARPLTAAVREWIARDAGTLLTLLGDFGSGKTSFCRYLAHALAREARADPEGAKRSPFFVDLREGGSTTVTLESLLVHRCQQLTSRPVNVQALLRLNREGHLVLIFDGFDEILGYSHPARFLDNLRQILRAAVGRAKVILTCRTHYFRDRPEEMEQIGSVSKVLTTSGATQLYEAIRERPGAEIAYLREFTPEQVDAYLEKAVPEGTDWKAFREQIRQVYNLRDLARRPFLLEIIVKSLPSLEPRADGSAVTIVDLYETYCASWFDQTDSRLALTRKYKETLVEHLACRLWNEPELAVHHSKLFDAAAEFFEDRPLNPNEKEQVDYEVRTALFLHRDADGNYRFIHRSFLEFFVARTLRAGLANGDRSCLALRPLTREVAFFLEQWPEAEKVPELAKEVLAGAFVPRVSENALRLLYFHVRTRVAGPLVGPEADEQDADDVLTGISELFGELRPDAVDLAGADLGGAMLRGADLAGARLGGACFDGADLRGVVAERSDLEGASLAFADLRRARLQRARLADAVLDHADARGAVLRGAVLDRADLTFARFAGADLAEASTTGARTMGTAFLGASGIEVDAARRLLFVPQVGHAWRVLTVAWHPDGKLVASGGTDATVRLWDPSDGRLLAVLEGHSQSVWSVAWDPAGERLASGSLDHTVKIWEAKSGSLDKTLSVAWAARGLSWDAAGRLAVASLSGIVEIWDVSGEPRRLAKLYQVSPLTGLAVTEDGYVDGPPEALRNVRFADGWALYDLDDLPQRHSPERVRAALSVRTLARG